MQEQKDTMKKVIWGEEGYPKRLQNLSGAPKQLFYYGELPKEDQPTAAVIGARDCSEYGIAVTKKLGETLGRNGIQVISGMARGIDGIAQRAALQAGGTSYGVLGSGADICYPNSNRGLYEELKQKGGIISEYEPGMPPLAQNFPPRNRIVSGLADVLIVVEAREKSGTLITVDMALEQGKDVYVVPGRITDRLSDGCNRLIRMGAGVLTDPVTFVNEVWGVAAQMTEEDAAFGLDGELLAVYRALEYSPTGLEQIRHRLPKKYVGIDLTTRLVELCIKSLAVQVSPGSFCLRKQ